MDAGNSATLQAVLAACRQQLAPHYATAQQEAARKERRWQAEEPLLRDTITALSGTRDVILREQKQLKTELGSIKAAIAKHEASAQATSSNNGQLGGPAGAQELRDKLAALNIKVTELDAALAGAKAQLAGQCREEERAIYETTLVVMQDTRRLLCEELACVKSEVQRIQATAKYESDRARADQLGWGDLSRLAEQLAQTEAKLDRAKQAVHFPEALGYKFSGGGGGIYCGAKDLFISEISGRFELTLELATKPDGTQVARMSAQLSGVTGAPVYQGHGGRGSEAGKGGAARGMGKQQAKHGRQGQSMDGQQGEQGQDVRQEQQAAGVQPLQPQQPQQPQQQEQQQQQVEALVQQQHGDAQAQVDVHGAPADAAAGAAGDIAQAKEAVLQAAPQAVSQAVPQAEQQQEAVISAPGGLETASALTNSGDMSALSTSPEVRRAVDDVPDAAVAPILAPIRTQPGLSGAQQQQSRQVEQATTPAEALVIDHSNSSSKRSSDAGSTVISPIAGGQRSSNDGISAASPSNHMNNGSNAGPQGSSTNSSSVPASPVTSSSGMMAGQRPLAGGKGLEWGAQLSGGGTGANRRGLMVNKFLNNLSDKKDKLKHAIQNAGDRIDRAITEGPQHEGGSPSSSGRFSGRVPGEPGMGSDVKSGFNKLASAFHEKRRTGPGPPEPTPGLPGLSPQGSGLSALGHQGSGGAEGSSGGGTPVGGASPMGGRRSEDGLHAGNAMLGGGLGAVRGKLGGLLSDTRAFSKNFVEKSEHLSKGLVERSEALTKGLVSDTRALSKGFVDKSETGLRQLKQHMSLGNNSGHGGADSSSVQRHHTGGSASAGPGAVAAAVQQMPQLPAGAAVGSSSGTAPAIADAPGKQDGAAILPSSPAADAPDAASSEVASSQHQQQPQQQQQQQQQRQAGSVAHNAGAAAHELDGRERRGLHVTLFGESVEVIGEKGTKVPNISIRQAELEVEAALVASFEYSPVLGWQLPERLSFEVLHLERRVEGSNLPLPKTLIRSLLNMVMPSVFTKVFLTSLPHELGKYVLDSGQGLALAGELRCGGPDLACLRADLSFGPGDLPAGAGKPQMAKYIMDLKAAQRARHLLSLTEPQAKALALLFSSSSGLLPQTLTSEGRGKCSIVELSRLWALYGESAAWAGMCEAWQAALQATSSAVRPLADHPVSFRALMEGPVARLSRKPLRIAFAVERLTIGFEVDCALAAVRDYFERIAREFEKQKGGDAALARIPLTEQLEMLNLWHQSLVTGLRAFKARFLSAQGSLLASADRELFQVGVEGVHYEGPLKLQVPLPVLMDPEHTFLFDIRLPDPKHALNSLAYKVRTILDQLSMVAFGSTAADHENAGSQASAVDALIANEGLSPSLQQSLQQWNNDLNQQQLTPQQQQQQQQQPTGAPGNQVGTTATAINTTSSSNSNSSAPALAGRRSSSIGGDKGLLQTPVIGRVTLKRVLLALRLDERRVGELLAGGMQDGQLVGSLLGCFGNLFTASLAPGWPSDVAPGADVSVSPKCVVTLKNSEVTRVRADLESAMFESRVPPRIAVRLLHAVALGVAQRFQRATGKQMRWLDSLFEHLHEYLSKDSLDALVCLHARAEVQDDSLRISITGNDGRQQPQQRKASSGGGAAPAASTAGDAVYPVYVVNDVNLLQVLDTVKLMMDY